MEFSIIHKLVFSREMSHTSKCCFLMICEIGGGTDLHVICTLARNRPISTVLLTKRIFLTMIIFLLSVSVWPLNSGLTRNKREPQEIQNAGYQLYRYEMCLHPAWLLTQRGLACGPHLLNT